MCQVMVDEPPLRFFDAGSFKTLLQVVRVAILQMKTGIQDISQEKCFPGYLVPVLRCKCQRQGNRLCLFQQLVRVKRIGEKKSTSLI